MDSTYNKSGTIYSCKCRSEIHSERERMSGRYHSYTDPVNGNGAAGRYDRRKPSG